VGGARWNATKSVMLAATFTQFAFFERSVAPRARDMNGLAITYAAPSRWPDSAGTYGQGASVLSLAAQYSF